MLDRNLQRNLPSRVISPWWKVKTESEVGRTAADVYNHDIQIAARAFLGLSNLVVDFYTFMLEKDLDYRCFFPRPAIYMDGLLGFT